MHIFLHDVKVQYNKGKLALWLIKHRCWQTRLPHIDGRRENITTDTEIYMGVTLHLEVGRMFISNEVKKNKHCVTKCDTGSRNLVGKYRGKKSPLGKFVCTLPLKKEKKNV
jgi:hypothetical protein